jgi:hypothetical protein
MQHSRNPIPSVLASLAVALSATTTRRGTFKRTSTTRTRSTTSRRRRRPTVRSQSNSATATARSTVPGWNYLVPPLSPARRVFDRQMDLSAGAAGELSSPNYGTPRTRGFAAPIPRGNTPMTGDHTWQTRPGVGGSAQTGLGWRGACSLGWRSSSSLIRRAPNRSRCLPPGAGTFCLGLASPATGAGCATNLERRG